MKVLLVEDNPDHYELIKSAILGFDDGIEELIHATSLEEARLAIAQQRFDIILFDLSLPDSSIPETVDYLTQLECDSPIVVLSTLDDIGIAKELLRHQIQDYVPKDEISSSFLNRVCTYAIERKRQQNKLDNRNKDMQAFCSMLSHDFKGSVRRISHIANFLAEDLSERIELTENENKFFDSIQRNTASIQSMVDSLHEYLTVSYTAISLEPIELDSLVDELILELKETQTKTFELSKNSKLGSIKGNTSLIKLMFQNMLCNSIKYNENKPVINLLLKNISSKKIEINISDNGIGIDKKFHQEIFKPFKRLYGNDVYPGTGLGLSIVARIVELHQGEICVESELGKGSTFTITLPTHA